MPAHFIKVRDLCVGMFVYLDAAWDHGPFPAASFRITTSKQLEALINLGADRIRWSPDRSEIGRRGEATGHKPERRSSSAATEFEIATECRRQFEAATEELREIQRTAIAHRVAGGVGATLLAGKLVEAVENRTELCLRLVPITLDDVAAHSMNVSVLSLMLGRAFDWSTAELRDMTVGALLHDIGKCEGLRRKGLDDSARDANTHVADGLAAARDMRISSASMDVIADHHERVDGSGAPRGIRSDRMSPAARLVALVNEFDNLCHPSPDSRALLPHEAMSAMLQKAGSHHDPGLVAAFVKAVGIYPAGSIVQLTDGRRALVLRVRTGRMPAIRVQIISGVSTFHQWTPDAGQFVDLVQPGVLGIRRALKMSDLLPGEREALPVFRRSGFFWDLESAKAPDGCSPGPEDA
jgi:putative nucleotidyltransferase with HDIG domain